VPPLALVILFISAAAPGPAPAQTPSTAVVDSLFWHQRFLDATEAGVALLRQSYEAHGALDPTTIDAMGQLARVASGARDGDLSLDLATSYREMAEAYYGRDHPEAIRALVQYALAYRQTVEFGGALAILEEAARRIEPYRDVAPRTYAYVIEALGNHHRWNHPTRSVEIQREVLELRRRLLPPGDIDIVDDVTWLGFALVHKGRHRAAKRYLDEAEAGMRALGLTEHSQFGTILGARGEIAVIEGRFEAAESLFAECGRLHANARSGYEPGLSAVSAHGYQFLAYVQLRMGRDAEAWRSLQLYRAHATMDYLSILQARDVAPAEFARLAALRQDYLDRHAARLAAGSWHDAAFWTTFLAELEAKAAMGLAIRAVAQKSAPSYPAVAEVARRLDPGTAYVGWLPIRVADWYQRSRGATRRALYAYVIRPDSSLHWVRIYDDEGTPAPALRMPGDLNLRWHYADSWEARIAWDPRLHEASRAWAHLLVDPLRPHLEGIERLVVEFSGEATAVPIGSLAGPTGGYIGDEFSISYVPGAAAFMTLTGAPAPRTPGTLPLLALGDPVFSEEEDEIPLDTRVPAAVLRRGNMRRDDSHVGSGTVRSVLDGDLDALASLPRLYFSAREVADISRSFEHSRRLLREDAHERELERMQDTGELSDFGVIHVATHALVDPGMPRRCALALSHPGAGAASGYDGLIEGREILYGWAIRAELFTLSCCQTAMGNWSRGEPLGFLQQLFAAGARSVLASTWKVDDEATSLLMTRFYEDWTGNYDGDRGAGAGAPMSRADALRDARRYVRTYEAPDGSHPFEHPLYWSGFILTGDPR
jgi:CHAT domain-containing protein/tetratricopeptide (TPR) repeat protein